MRWISQTISAALPWMIELTACLCALARAVGLSELISANILRLPKIVVMLSPRLALATAPSTKLLTFGNYDSMFK